MAASLPFWLQIGHCGLAGAGAHLAADFTKKDGADHAGGEPLPLDLAAPLLLLPVWVPLGLPCPSSLADLLLLPLLPQPCALFEGGSRCCRDLWGGRGG